MKRELADRKVRVVALDLPTSHMMMVRDADDFTSRMFEAINAMLLDMLLGLVAEALLGSPAALGRQFERELKDYLERGEFGGLQDGRKPAST